MRQYNVAVVGATGIVGETLISILEERHFPVAVLYPLASSRSMGTSISFQNKSYQVEELTSFDFTDADIVFFCVSAAISKRYVPLALQAGCLVIDNSSQFRYEDNVPLIIPEVNGKILDRSKFNQLIANPNCSTIQMLVALKPLYDTYGITRIDVSTYQSVSGAGNDAVEALARQSAAMLSGQSFAEDITDIAHQNVTEKSTQLQLKQVPLAFNAIPHIDHFEDNGYTREEMKMIWETHKIFEDDTINIIPTAVRVPVFFAHSESIVVNTLKPIDMSQLRLIFAKQRGLQLIEGDDYPMAVTHAANQDDVFVGRLRKGLNDEHTLAMWVVADNVRKGAALNAIQIAEYCTVKDLVMH